MTNRIFQIHLTSKNAIIYQNGNINDAWYDLPYKSISSENEIHISLVHAVIPYSWYSINNNNNKLVFVTNDNTKITFYIPIGNYTGINLASQITSQINSYSNGGFVPIINFNCSYDLKTSKLTFVNQYYFEIDFSSTILEVLGIVSNNTSNLTATSPLAIFTLICENAINLIPHQCVCITCPNIESENVHIGVSQH